MGFASDPYANVVSIYVNQFKQDSLRAAAAIEQIQVNIDSKAALRAALLLTIFRIEVKQNHWIPDVSIYAYLLWAYPKAVPLLEYAMSCCLHDWGIRNVELARMQVSDIANPDASHIWRQRNNSRTDKPMDSGSDLYDDIVPAYIGVIKQDSQDAAAVVAEILSNFGSRAALRATLVITLLKMDVQNSRSVENVTIQTHLINEFPAALPLLERAIAFCLQVWTSFLVESTTRSGNASLDPIKPTPMLSYGVDIQLSADTGE